MRRNFEFETWRGEEDSQLSGAANSEDKDELARICKEEEEIERSKKKGKKESEDRDGAKIEDEGVKKEK